MTMYDAVVVGGGPAGLAAGIVLAEHGSSVLLCEAKRLPADKPCGEGLMPSGVTCLEQLGVSRAMLGQGWRSFCGIRYVAPSGRGAEATFAEGPGLGIRRTALSAALLERTRHLPGLVVVDQTRVELGRELRVDGLPIDTRLIVGADGLHSHVRRWAGLEGRGRAFQRWGARRHFRMKPWTPFVEVLWSTAGVEAYITPTGVERIGVAFLWDRERMGPLPGRRKRCWRGFRRCGTSSTALPPTASSRRSARCFNPRAT
jgi:2-polyprenyl-6-methoxyphenol hydroxylase-like FAD-dependent oxidoreductase